MNKHEMRIVEVSCFNLATNYRGLNKQQVGLLKKYRRQIEIVASKNYTLGEKRGVIKQKGGFIGAVLPILGTLAAAFLTK